MMEAADFAAPTAAGVIIMRAADSSAAVTIGLRVAIALVSNSPYLLCGDNVPPAIIDARLSLTS